MAAKQMSRRRGTRRESLIAAMSRALKRSGYYGIGLNELLAEVKAPKGVLYHHFPEGKMELAIAAVQSRIDEVCSLLDDVGLRSADPLSDIQRWFDESLRILAARGFAEGCPLGSMALESTPKDTAVRGVLADGFAAIRQRLAMLLERAFRTCDGEALAGLIVSAYEGALMQARVASRMDSMRLATESLFRLLRSDLTNNRT